MPSHPPETDPLNEILQDKPLKPNIRHIIGKPGAGKTILALHMVEKMARSSRENVLWISLKSPLTSVFRNTRRGSFQRYRRFLKSKRFMSHHIKHVNDQTIANIIRKASSTLKSRRIGYLVIDGLSYIDIEISGRDKRVLLHEALLKWLRSLKNTSIILVGGVDGQGAEYSTAFRSDVVLQLSFHGSKRQIALLKHEHLSVIDSGPFAFRILKQGVEASLEQAERETTPASFPFVATRPTARLIILSDFAASQEGQRRQFEKMHPHIKVEIRPCENYQEKLDWLRTEKKAGLMMTISARSIPAFVQQGLLKRLDELIHDYSERFFPQAMAACKFNGHLYAISEDISCRALIYRKDLYDKHGFMPPQTWEEWIDQVLYIKQNDNEMDGILFVIENSSMLMDTFLEFLWSNGGDIFDSDGNIVIGNERGLETLQFMHDLVYKHKVSSPKTMIQSSEGNMWKRFSSGQVVSLNTFPYILNYLDGDISSPIRGKAWLAPLPHGPHGDRSHTILHSACYVISDKTPYAEEAVSFLRFFIESDFIRKCEQVVGSGCAFPARKGTCLDPRVLDVHPHYREADEILNHGRLISHAESYELIRPVIQEEVYKTVAAGQVPEESMEKIVDRIGPLCKRKTHRKTVEEAMNFIHVHYNSPKLADIAKEVRLNKDYLSRLFKANTGKTLVEYINHVRLERAEELLRDVRCNIGEVCKLVGYNSIDHFCRLFKRRTGLTPSAYREQKLSD